MKAVRRGPPDRNSHGTSQPSLKWPFSQREAEFRQSSGWTHSTRPGNSLSSEVSLRCQPEREFRGLDRWGLLIFEGLLDIATGVVAFLWPGLTVVAFVWLIAAWAIVSGGLMTAAGFRLNIEHGRWWLVLGGLLSLAYGVLLIITLLIGAIVLTWWLGAYALVFGIALVIFSFKLRSRQHERVNSTVVGTTA